MAVSQTIPQARVVRLMSEPEPGKWRLGINGADSSAVLSSDLTNEIAQLHMRQGDLILLGSLPDFTNSAAPIWRWLSAQCESNRIAIYHYRMDNRMEAANLFSIPVYNWTAPFENPRKLSDAAFFREGHFLGSSVMGFQRMLDDIERSRPKKIFILGSLYDMNTQFSILEYPWLGGRLRCAAFRQGFRAGRLAKNG